MNAAGLIWLAFACGVVSGYMLGTLLPPKAKAEEDEDPPCATCGRPSDCVRFVSRNAFICLCSACNADAEFFESLEQEARGEQ